FIAQNLALDGLLYPLVYQQLVDGALAARGASAISMVTQFMGDWFDENAKWVDNVVRVAAAESPANAALLAEWFGQWNARAAAALLPIIAPLLGTQADAALSDAQGALARRNAKSGLAA
ncbi:MAG: phenol hydroxylase, partial [Sphingopyxis sp.]